ncbi:MAG: hypothetical protein ONB24_12615 [candidate division KSB1 bacterium]|nr:hypothetical protein [candidate division KSB1 bacterium]
MGPAKRIAVALFLVALVVAAAATLSVVGRTARTLDAVILFTAGLVAGVSLALFLRKKSR